MAEVERLGNLEKFLIKIQAPKMENKVNFFRLMAVTQKAGLGIKDSLSSIKRSETHPGMKRILDDLLNQVNQGTSLADALENHNYFFENEEIELIRSSETMGNLPDVLENIADELENFQKIKSKLKNALIYPAVVLVFAAIAVVILLVKVMPVIVDLFPSKEDLPGITKFMLGASDFLQEKWGLLLVIAIAIPIVYKFLYSKILPFKILMDKFFLKAPLVGELNRKFNHYRFAKLLGDFYNAGVNPSMALGQISDILANYHYKTKVSNIKNDLEVGLDFTESMEGSWLFDQILIQIIGIGESTGNIGEVLTKISTFYREEVDNKVEGLMKAVEPLLMAFVAVIIGVIVAAVFLPMADLIGNIGR